MCTWAGTRTAQMSTHWVTHTVPWQTTCIPLSYLILVGQDVHHVDIVRYGYPQLLAACHPLTHQLWRTRRRRRVKTRPQNVLQTIRHLLYAVVTLCASHILPACAHAHRCSVVTCKGSIIRHTGCCHKHTANNIVNLCIQVLWQAIWDRNIVCNCSTLVISVCVCARMCVCT